MGSVIFYVLLIGLVNLGLGYALCVHLQRGAAVGPRPIVVPGQPAHSPSSPPDAIELGADGHRFGQTDDRSTGAAATGETDGPSRQQELMKGIDLFREQLAGVRIAVGPPEPVSGDDPDLVPLDATGQSPREAPAKESPVAEWGTDDQSAQATADHPEAEQA